MIPSAQPAMNAIIIDDEETACHNLQHILLEFVSTPLRVLGTATDTSTAEQLMQQHQPDVIFLDIDMPLENGFDFLERIQPFSFEVIFVTAYDEYAVKAFRLNALDYILKPVNIQELNSAVQKLYERYELRKLAGNRLNRVFYKLPEQPDRWNPTHIQLREGSEIVSVRFDDLLYFEASSSYCKVVFWKRGIEKSITMGYPLAEYEGLLPAGQFYRIHKSYLVNGAQISKLLKEEHPAVVLKNGARLPVGRRRYQAFLAFMKANNYLV